MCNEDPLDCFFMSFPSVGKVLAEHTDDHCYVKKKKKKLIMVFIIKIIIIKSVIGE